MKLLLSVLLTVSICTSAAAQEKIKTVNAYEKTYEEIIGLRDPLKKTVIIFSVSWCGPCKILKKKLEDNTGINYKEVQIFYVVTDTNGKGERSEDGMANAFMTKSLEEIGQGYWPFILLFESSLRSPVSKFPLAPGHQDPCPDKLFYDRIMDFINDSRICK